MAMPAGVKKQVDRANELINQLGLDAPKDDAPPATPPPLVEVPTPTAETLLPPAQPELPPPQAASPPPTTVVQPPQPPAPPAEDWEHKYKVLQGKYNSEVPRLSGQLATLQAQVAELNSKLTAAPPAAPTKSTLISQEEIDEFGPELVDLIGRRAKEIYDPMVSELRSEVTQLKGQLGTQAERDFTAAREKLVDELGRRVPNYLQVNGSQEFLQWLDQADAYSGEQRGQMLTRAFEVNDTERVIRFFTGFLSEHAAVSPPPPAPGSQQGTPRVDLSQHIAPGTSTVPPASGAQNEKRIWTQPEIAAFYAAVNRGEFKRNPEDRQRIEKDIIAAGREGRIRS